MRASSVGLWSVGCRPSTCLRNPSHWLSATTHLLGYQPIIAAGLNAQMGAAPGRLTPSE